MSDAQIRRGPPWSTARVHFRLGLVLAALAAGCARGDVQLAIENVTVVDTRASLLRPGITLLIAGDRIARIAPHGDLRVPAGAERIDGSGRYLIPGLWDMHVHLSNATELALPVLVAHGVTGVRDMGSALDTLDRWRAEIATGARIGPRIFRPGPVVDGPKDDAPYRLTVRDSSGAVAAAEKLRAAGVDFIKIHNAVPRAAYFVLLDAAHQRGLDVAGHIPTSVSPAEAARAGQRSFEHLTTLFEGTLAASAPRDPRAMLPWYERYLESAVDTLIDPMVAHGTWVAPNLVGTETRARRAEIDATPDPRLRYVAASLRAHWDRYFPVSDLDRNPMVVELRARFQELLLQLTGRLQAHGVPLVAASDLGLRDIYPGGSLHDELELLVRAGLTPLQALAAATIEPAMLLGAADSLGAVAEGQLADLVLLDADPSAEIGNVRRVVAVVLNGEYLDKDRLTLLLEEAAAMAPAR